MNIEHFRELIEPVTEAIGGRALDATLAAQLNADFPAHGEVFRRIEAACHAAIEAGWMCSLGGPGRRFGRVIEPGPETRGLSVDVVDLADVVGPHHRHPTGEVCLIMPIDDGAKFCGAGAGWTVYEPDSAHYPTVTSGEALVLYLLPDGEIEFTGQPAPEASTKDGS